MKTKLSSFCTLLLMATKKTFFKLTLGLLLISPSVSHADTLDVWGVNFIDSIKVNQSLLLGQMPRIHKVIDSCSTLDGWTIRVRWDELEPQDNVFNWVGLDSMVSLLTSRGLDMSLELVAGWGTPDYVYDTYGARFFENTGTPVYVGNVWGWWHRSPVVWDTIYKQYWKRCITQIAQRYATTQFQFVNIVGMNHTIEMYMPRTLVMPPTQQMIDSLYAQGFSALLFDQEWKSWIDFYGTTFPANIKINLVLSSTRDTANSMLAGLVQYAANNYPGRVFLMNHNLNGNGDHSCSLPVCICLNHPNIPYAFEMDMHGAPTIPTDAIKRLVHNLRQLNPVHFRIVFSPNYGISPSATNANNKAMNDVLNEYEIAKTMSPGAYAIYIGSAYIPCSPACVITTSVNENNSEIPREFSLEQNYPNPFNPTTHIKFGLPNSSFVKLTVFDVLGKEVTVLVNEKLNAGKYQADWDGTSFASGVYYYHIVIHSDKLTTGDYVETRKMVLIK